MIDIDINRQSLDAWQAGVSRKFRKELEDAQADIRGLWRQELVRQQRTRGDGSWAPLHPIYAKRKSREYADAQNGDVRFNSILRRSGKMLDGYSSGIQFETTNTKVSVIMPYPPNGEGKTGKTINVRARSHQGEIGQPVGVPIRSFNLERLKAIALERFNRAMKRAAGNE